MQLLVYLIMFFEKKCFFRNQIHVEAFHPGHQPCLVYAVVIGHASTSGVTPPVVRDQTKDTYRGLVVQRISLVQQHVQTMTQIGSKYHNVSNESGQYTYIVCPSIDLHYFNMLYIVGWEYRSYSNIDMECIYY